MLKRVQYDVFFEGSYTSGRTVFEKREQTEPGIYLRYHDLALLYL